MLQLNPLASLVKLARENYPQTTLNLTKSTKSNLTKTTNYEKIN